MLFFFPCLFLSLSSSTPSICFSYFASTVSLNWIKNVFYNIVLFARIMFAKNLFLRGFNFFLYNYQPSSISFFASTALNLALSLVTLIVFDIRVVHMSTSLSNAARLIHQHFCNLLYKDKFQIYYMMYVKKQICIYTGCPQKQSTMLYDKLGRQFQFDWTLFNYIKKCIPKKLQFSKRGHPQPVFPM